jgi:hypothetical protein
MTPAQKDFLNNLTVERAQKLIAKFDCDPAAAEAKSAETFHAFSVCWSFLNPGEYIQRHNAPGGVNYRFIGI